MIENWLATTSASFESNDTPAGKSYEPEKSVRATPSATVLAQPEPIEVVVLPPDPKVRSGEPSPLKRAKARSHIVPASLAINVCPLTRILPSG